MNVKIGPFLYQVYRVPDLKDDDGIKLDGHLVHSRSQILLLDGMDEQATLQTLVHEIVHEIAIQRGQKLDEGQVDALAFGWIEVMQSNPELVSVIMKSKTPKRSKKAKGLYE